MFTVDYFCWCSVVILRIEYVAFKWPMKVQFCKQDMEKEAIYIQSILKSSPILYSPCGITFAVLPPSSDSHLSYGPGHSWSGTGLGLAYAVWFLVTPRKKHLLGVTSSCFLKTQKIRFVFALSVMTLTLRHGL